MNALLNSRNIPPSTITPLSLPRLVGTTSIGFNLFLGSDLSKEKGKTVLRAGIGLATVVAFMASVCIMLAGSGDHGKNTKPFKTAMVAAIFEEQLGPGWVKVFAVVFILASYSSMVTVSRGAAVVFLDIMTEPSKKTSGVPSAGQPGQQTGQDDDGRISPTGSGESGTAGATSSDASGSEGAGSNNRQEVGATKNEVAGAAMMEVAAANNQEEAGAAMKEVAGAGNKTEAGATKEVAGPKNQEETEAGATKEVAGATTEQVARTTGQEEEEETGLTGQDAAESGAVAASQDETAATREVTREEASGCGLWLWVQERWQGGGFKETDEEKVGKAVEVFILVTGALAVALNGQ